jgi:hypothetical protein
MVVIADRLSATEEAALRAAIDCLHAGRRRRGNKPQKRERRRRPEEFSSFNPNSLWSVPEGYYGRCPVPTCREAIPMHRAEEDIVRCSRGHVHSQEAEAERYWEGKRNKRRDPHSGLCPTDAGRIAEATLYRQRNLGSFGKINWRHDTYQSKVDFLTDRGFAIECKAVDFWSEFRAFCLGSDERIGKTTWAWEHSCRPAGASVGVDLPRMEAHIYLRCWDDDEFHGFKWPKNEAPWLIRPLVVPPEILQKLKAIERAAMPKRSRPRAKKKKQDIPF